MEVLDKFIKKNNDQANRYLQIIEDMMSEYDWAQDTLLDIYDFVWQNNYITAGQIKAIENIKYGKKY